MSFNVNSGTGIKSLLCFQPSFKPLNISAFPRRSFPLQPLSRIIRPKQSIWTTSQQMYQIPICLYLLMKPPRTNAHLAINMAGQWKACVVASRGALFMAPNTLSSLPFLWMASLPTRSLKDQLIVSASLGFYGICGMLSFLMCSIGLFQSRCLSPTCTLVLTVLLSWTTATSTRVRKSVHLLKICIIYCNSSMCCSLCTHWD